MKLVGSRSTNTHDIFSDWDFHVETQADFQEIAAKIDSAVAWTVLKRGSLNLATVIDPAGVMWDYAGPDGRWQTDWDALNKPSAEDYPIQDYWIIAFKHLKGLYRGYDELGAVGIEMSTGLARDIYIGRKYSITNYKNFFAYKQFAPMIEADQTLKQATGLAYTTTKEKLAKLTALNHLILEVSKDVSEDAFAAFQLQLQNIG